MSSAGLISRRSGQRAFTLVEILVVVAIVALLAAMAAVNVLRARMVAQEQAALSDLQHVAKACHQYFAVNNVFPDTLTLLGPPTSNPSYLDAQLIGDGSIAVKGPYVFTYVGGLGGINFTLRANPSQHGVGGVRHFYINRDLAVHVTTENRNANVDDPILQ